MKQQEYKLNEKKTERAIKKAWRQARFKCAMKKSGKWIRDNKEIVLVLGPAVIGLTTVVVTKSANVITSLINNLNLRKEKQLKDFYCYDRSLGHYWALRRELSNREWTEIDQRKAKGERLADILNELHVLK